MKKKTEKGKPTKKIKNLLIILVCCILLQSAFSSFCQTPELSRQLPGSKTEASIWRVTKPLALCFPASGTEIERILKVIRQENLPNRKTQSQKIYSNIAYAIFGNRMIGFYSTYLWRITSFPSNQMRRSLIAYIHHKEDQF